MAEEKVEGAIKCECGHTIGLWDAEVHIVTSTDTELQVECSECGATYSARVPHDQWSKQ